MVVWDDDEQKVLREIAAIKDTPELPIPPRPHPPVFGSHSTVRSKLFGCQSFINAFEYNHTGSNYFSMRRDRGMRSIAITAKEIMREALPIQCVEGVFLGVYLTSGMRELERIPISFKSSVNGQIFRHIVLAVRHQKKWGALGLSRRPTLMYKELKYDSLGDLITNYRDAYGACFHKVLKVYIGLPFQHDLFSDEIIKWRALSVEVESGDWSEACGVFNRFAAHASRLLAFYVGESRLPEGMQEAILNGSPLLDLIPTSPTKRPWRISTAPPPAGASSSSPTTVSTGKGEPGSSPSVRSGAASPATPTATSVSPSKRQTPKGTLTSARTKMKSQSRRGGNKSPTKKSMLTPAPLETFSPKLGGEAGSDGGPSGFPLSPVVQKPDLEATTEDDCSKNPCEDSKDPGEIPAGDGAPLPSTGASPTESMDKLQDSKQPEVSKKNGESSSVAQEKGDGEDVPVVSSRPIALVTPLSSPAVAPPRLTYLGV